MLSVYDMRKEELFSRPSINWLLLQSRVSAARLTARPRWAVTTVPGIPAQAGGLLHLAHRPRSRPAVRLRFKRESKQLFTCQRLCLQRRHQRTLPPSHPPVVSAGTRPSHRSGVPGGTGTSKFQRQEGNLPASTSPSQPTHSQGCSRAVIASPAWRVCRAPGVPTQHPGLETGGQQTHSPGRTAPRSEQVRPHTVPWQRRQGPGPRPWQRAGEGGNGSDASSGFSPARGSPPWRRNVTLTPLLQRQRGGRVAPRNPWAPPPSPHPPPLPGQPRGWRGPSGLGRGLG